MKLKKIVGVLALVSMMLLAGCTESKESMQIKAGEGFLKEFYTFNKDGRYDEFEAVMEAVRDDKTITEEKWVSIMEEAFKKYYGPMSEYASEKALKFIINNRFPISMEDGDKKYGKTLEVDSVTLEVTEENKYNWILAVKSTNSSEEETIIEQKGQMIFNEDNKIDSVYFENLKALAGK